MFEIRLRPGAVRQLKKLRPYDAVRIVSAMEEHLQLEPERISASRIKRLRGSQDATFRLRVGEYRVFYDVADVYVDVIAVLHKSDTEAFYQEEQS
jgi:mRNA-degrading endonuclease RelE of RelBE toxin-antitoxin system